MSLAECLAEIWQGPKLLQLYPILSEKFDTFHKAAVSFVSILRYDTCMLVRSLWRLQWGLNDGLQHSWGAYDRCSGKMVMKQGDTRGLGSDFQVLGMYCQEADQGIEGPGWLVAGGSSGNAMMRQMAWFINILYDTAHFPDHHSSHEPTHTDPVDNGVEPAG